MKSSKEVIYCSSFRRNGPEEDLIDHFLESVHVTVPLGYKIFIFKEPRLESGTPDLVFVQFRDKSQAIWPEERKKINNFDIRLMHYITCYGPITIPDIQVIFKRNCLDSLDRLQRAKMIRNHGGHIKARLLSHIYAIRSIVSIEAKIQDWKIALNQAFLNTWFSSHSYILMPKVPSSPSFKEIVNRLNIGVFSMDGKIPSLKFSKQKNNQPLSYCSWYFNELAWKTEIRLNN